MQNFERFLCATRSARLSPASRSKPKIAEIMLFQASSDTPPLLNPIFKCVSFVIFVINNYKKSSCEFLVCSQIILSQEDICISGLYKSQNRKELFCPFGFCVLKLFVNLLFFQLNKHRIYPLLFLLLR